MLYGCHPQTKSQIFYLSGSIELRGGNLLCVDIMEEARISRYGELFYTG